MLEQARRMEVLEQILLQRERHHRHEGSTLILLEQQVLVVQGKPLRLDLSGELSGESRDGVRIR